MYSSFSSQGSASSGGGWIAVNGTSESAPLFAGIAAIADQAVERPLGALNSYLYRDARLPGANGIVPVTSGNTTVTITSSSGTLVVVPGYSATASYNLATGLGTVDAAGLVRSLANLARRRGALPES